MSKILLISPYWREEHRWMVSSVKLAELWQRIGYHVDVVCMGSESTKRRRISPQATIQFKKDVFLPDPWNYGICPGFSGLVRKRVREDSPDIIVVNKLLFWTSLALIPIALRGRKVVLLVDALVGMTWWPRGFLPRVCAAMYAWTIGWMILRCASRIVFFHPQPPSLLSNLGIAKKSTVIPTGIDEIAYVPPSQQEGVPGRGSVTVTYIGRLESVKGVDDFLAAVVPLQKEHANLHIRVIGWYKEGHPLVQQYKDKENVTFTGLVSTGIALEYAKTDIFVMPSHSEGLSNALMEAMASGCACVASDVGGNRYLIQSGVSGFLFPAGDREALRAHVKRLINDPAKRLSLGQAARKRIEEHFSWNIVGKQYQEFFASL